MLPMLAMLVTGYMAKQRSGAAPAAGPARGGLTAALGGLLGTQSIDSSDDDLGGLLKMGSQRNPLDEIMGRLGR
jgi:hypothetical protein